MAKVRRLPKTRITVRHQGAREGLAQFGYGLFRFVLYGFAGIALEVFFYNLVRNLAGVPVLGLLFQFIWRVDPKLDLNHIWNVPAISLYGQCSLWMFLVYGVACFAVEFEYRNLTDVRWPLRALLYGLTIFLWECASGWLLLGVSGFKIWEYLDSGNFFQMTSWYILPIWCVTGLFVEYLYRQLMDPALVRAIEGEHLVP